MLFRAGIYVRQDTIVVEDFVSPTETQIDTLFNRIDDFYKIVTPWTRIEVKTLRIFNIFCILSLL